jgi:NAD(P)H-dependent FMN reductase
MEDQRPLYIPVILGTTRRGRMSAAAAAVIVGQLAKRPAVQTELIDIASMPLPATDAGGHQGRSVRWLDGEGRRPGDRDARIQPQLSGPAEARARCCLEVIHKAVGIAGVSAGPFGGTRAIQNLLPVMRELGLVTIFWDVNFSSVHDTFDAAGGLRDQGVLRRVNKFLRELIWMSRTLRYGREQIAVDS